ncbi:MAG TPA: ribonuclease HII [Steroidobacteraceae bacterium]|nr:ribonuclease HII [Steroidobacteraceae bacterium]
MSVQRAGAMKAQVQVLTAGVDEAGRGPLAGPVVAAAVILDPQRVIRGLRDSKQLTAERRCVLAQRIRERALGFAIAEADHAEIDLLNILQATLLAMKRALIDLPVRPVRILIDGNRAPRLSDCFADCEVQTVVGGDALFACISAASILAKTHRDALMARLDADHPGYGLGRHFGYATRVHLSALVRLGPSPIHRTSFNPLRSWLSGALPFGVLPAEASLCSSEADEAALQDLGPAEACA